MLGLTRALAALLAPEKLRVSVLAPGATDTPTQAMNGEKAQDVIIALGPLKRLATADEMAATVVFLLRHDASFFTGQTISPNGGIVM
jgi:3-oxoacyl-[acyl-carrier protein] reductase